MTIDTGASEELDEPRRRPTTKPRERTMDDESDDFTQLDDSALLGWRAETRDKLEDLPPGSAEYATLTAQYDLSTTEVTERARKAWSRTS
jgi:hypothetical protein